MIGKGISGRTRVFGLIGHPVRHSLSPAMHSALFERLGLDAVYLAFDVHPDRAAGVADAIRTLKLVGVNLTIPFKERVMPHLDRITIAAQEAGSVNVVTNVDGFLTGYNTDGEGLLRALELEHGWRPDGARCLILGAGGAGRAVGSSLANAGAARGGFPNRTRARAESAAQHLINFFPATAFGAADLDPESMRRLAPRTDLVVNCLGGAGATRVAMFPVDALPTSAVWYDTNYWMANPPALKECRARGLRTCVGLGMLLHQGALSFELFTGHSIPASELEEIIGVVNNSSP